MKGFAITGWVMGLAGVFIVSTIGYAMRNEGVNATQTANISSIQEQFKGLKAEVTKEVREGVKDGVREAIKEISYQLPENNTPATSLVKGNDVHHDNELEN